MKRGIWVTLVAFFLGVSLFALPTAAQQMVHVKAAPSGADVTTTGSSFEDIPGLRAFFVAGQAGNAVVGVSGEFSVTAGQRMFLRAFIDGGAASPSDVALADGAPGSSAFNFTTNVTAGLHEVRIQWMVDTGGTATVGNRTVWVSTAPQVITAIAAPSGPDISTTADSSSPATISGLSTNFSMPSAGDAIITLTAETYTNTVGNAVWALAEIDGARAIPVDLMLANVSDRALRAFTFKASGLSAGTHSLDMKWFAGGSATAFMGDRTVTISVSDPVAIATGEGGVVNAVHDHVAGDAPPEAAPGPFVDIPNMTTTITTPENASMVIGFQAEVITSADGRLLVRALIDGEPASPGDALFDLEGWPGTRSFNFVAQNLSAGSHTITMQWKLDTAGAVAFIYARSLTVTALPTQNHTANCWWFNSEEPGTGVSIEVQADYLFLAWYSYDQTTGQPIWNTAGGPMTDPYTFSGSLMQFSGWELGTPYVAPQPTAVGTVEVEFDHAHSDLASLSWTIAGSAGSKDLEKFLPLLVGGEQDERNINGWWWDPAFNGMGVYVEARGGQIFIAWYQYRADGSPRWWSVGGAFAEGATSFTGTLQEYANGQWIGGNYQAPDPPVDVDPVTFTFNADGSATLAWSGTTFDLERFHFAGL